ncbi:putative ribonuclease H-like domain-containing protein [Tanacetum coccineum]
MSMPVQKPPIHKFSQDGKGSKWRRVVLGLMDLKDAQDHNVKYKAKGKVNPEINEHYNIFTREFVIRNLKKNSFKERGIQFRELKRKIYRLQGHLVMADPILDFKALDSQNKDLTEKVNALQDLNEHFRAENEKVKQHYKELYDSIKLTRAKTIAKTTFLLTEFKTLKAQIKGKTNCVTVHDHVKPKVLAPDLEVVFLKHSCYVRDVNGVDLIKGNRGTNLYTIYVEDMMKSSHICLLSKASKNKSWLWHRRLFHLNFGTINDLAQKDLDLQQWLLLQNFQYSIQENLSFGNDDLEQYFLMTDYALWEVIVNGDSPHQRELQDLMEAMRKRFGGEKVFGGCMDSKEIRKRELLKAFPSNVKDYKLCNFYGIYYLQSYQAQIFEGNPQLELQEKRVIDSGCSRHMTGNKSYLSYYEEIDGGFVAFRGDPKGGRITGKGKISTDTECVVLSPDFKLLDENHVLLRVPRKNNMTPREEGKDRLNIKEKRKDNERCQDTKEPRVNQEHDANVNITNNINTVSPTVNTADIENNAVDKNIVYGCIDDLNMPNLEEIVCSDDDEEVGAEADMNNLATTMPVWTLVELPYSKRAIGTKWVYRNKKDDRVARIEAIRLFLAYASFMNFIVYQMDVKSAFLYGTIEEEVYVCQPPGFEDPEFPNKVYKVEKALYGLHQAPRAWYETLSTYLLENRFRRGTIDKTLFIKKDKDDILLVQVYVDDIIFGSTKKSLCTEFEQMMHKRFQMSSMGELTFFLGLQVKQKDDGIFISQDKYVTDILKKFDFATVRTSSTPMETNKALLKDEEAADVDVHLYRLMIGSLMYLTTSRPDIMFAVCACARFQVTPKTSHLHAVKRIFRYLKGHPKLGLWYPRDSSFDLEAFSDSDYAGASLDRKSTTGGCQFLRRRLISWQCKKKTIFANSTIKAEYVAATYNTKIFIDNESTICIVKNPVFHSKTKHIEIRHHFIRDSYEKRLIQVIKIHTDHNVADLLTKAFDNQKPRKAKRTTEISQSSGPIPLITYETVIKEWEDRMERAATTASSLVAEQDSGNINRTQSMAILNESFPQGTGSGSGPRCQDTIFGGAKAQIRFEAAST